jgi:hypothetical protein
MAMMVIGGSGMPALTVPFEIVVAAGLLALCPSGEGRAGRGIRYAASGILILLLALRALDAAMQAVLGRAFLLAFDLPLVAAAAEFVAETYGNAVAVSAVAVVTVSVLAACGLILFCLGRIQDAMRRGWAMRTMILLVSSTVIGIQFAHWVASDRVVPFGIVSDESVRDLRSEARAITVRLADQSVYREAGALSPRPPVGLGGADVLVFLLESYGRSSIEDPRYGSTIVPSLRGMEDALRDRGFAMASGWLESPTFGGQSWLAHSSLLSGLWVDNQYRYRLLLSGKRPTLVRDFAAAGYRTVLLEPEISRPWPEAKYYGFDRTYFSWDMGYAGPPYDWVTMPDQYTLAFLDRAVRQRPRSAPPLFAMTVLVSSHAPWTPVAELVDDWSAIGDGRIFAAWAHRGEPPEVVWRDPRKVRRQYTRAMDYVIEVLGSYFRRFGAERRVLAILVGDHQPGPIISGATAGHDVPIHVLSNDPTLLRAFRDWGFTDGMVPAPDAPSRRMDSFRDWFLDSFSGQEDRPVAGTVEDGAG